MRGPKAALNYLRARERLLGPGTRGAEKASGQEPGGLREQKVYVLVDGFQGWQYTYGEDERLTEGYSKELWQDEDY